MGQHTWFSIKNPPLAFLERLQLTALVMQLLRSGCELTTHCFLSSPLSLTACSFLTLPAPRPCLYVSLSPSGSPLSLPSNLESPIPQHPSPSLLSSLPLFTAPTCVVLFLGSIFARKCHVPYVPYNACSYRIPNIFSFDERTLPKPR